MIDALRLTNFKCFGDQTLKFSSLNLLSGLNGTGKSTIIQSLLVLRQSYELGMQKSGRLFLNGELVRLGTAQDVLTELVNTERIGFEINSDSHTLKLEFSYDRESDVLHSTESLAELTGVTSQPFVGEFRYLQAERMGPRTAFPMSDLKVSSEFQIGTQGEYTAHFLSRFGRDIEVESSRRHPNAASYDLIDQIEAWMGEVSPGIRIEPSTVPNMDLASLSYRRGQLGNVYRSTNVGFGITYSLSLITVLLVAKRGSLLLLENPEAHLHPRGQSRMGELAGLCAMDGVQLIVETHSDHLLNGIRVAVRKGELNADAVSLFYFGAFAEGNTYEERVSTPRIDKNGRLDHWPNGFFDEWDKNIAQLLRPVK